MPKTKSSIRRVAFAFTALSDYAEIQVEVEVGFGFGFELRYGFGAESSLLPAQIAWIKKQRRNLTQIVKEFLTSVARWSLALLSFLSFVWMLIAPRARKIPYPEWWMSLLAWPMLSGFLLCLRKMLISVVDFLPYLFLDWLWNLLFSFFFVLWLKLRFCLYLDFIVYRYRLSRAIC